MDTIQINAFAVVEYELFSPEGELLDGSAMEDGEPIEYVHGYSMLVPGLEAALEGLAAGARRELTLTADDAYGERDEDLVFSIERGDVEDEELEVGDEVVTVQDGEEIALRVKSIDGDEVVVDGNHPLAGLALTYKVVVRSVRQATPGEIEAAARQLAEVEDDVAQHGMEESGLIQLGTKTGKA